MEVALVIPVVSGGWWRGDREEEELIKTEK
jgi:hypothetical protein